MPAPSSPARATATFQIPTIPHMIRVLTETPTRRFVIYGRLGPPVLEPPPVWRFRDWQNVGLRTRPPLPVWPDWYFLARQCGPPWQVLGYFERVAYTLDAET